MEFIRKRFAAKALSIFLATFLLASAAAYLLPSLHFIIIPAVFFAIASATVFIVIHRPFAKIFREMKALLVGHPYKKIFTRRIDEVGVLAHFFNTVTKNLERISVDVQEGKRLSKEMSVGTDIQRKILPTEMPKIEGISMFGNTRPASEVGGDSFDVMLTPQQAFIYVGDVTGHGLPAGLIMVMVNTLLRTFSEVYASGYDVIVNANRILKTRIEPRRFMTCVLLRWNISEKKLYFTGAGHEHILLYHRKEAACEVRQTGGIALGMVPDVSKIVREEQIIFEAGDFVVLYSDGIVEAKNMEGEMFGVARLKQAVEQYARDASVSPEQLFSAISKDFAVFVGDQIQEDDITLIAIKRT